MTSLLLAVAAFGALFGLPAAAYHRRGFRGAYVALAIAALVLGAGCGMMPISSPAELHALRAPERQAAELIDGMATPFMLLMGCVSLGGLLGACLYRAPEA